MHGIGTQSVAAPRIKGAVRRDVNRVRQAGRFGDTQLAHIGPEADALLKEAGGAGTRNPETGLKEHFKLKDLISFAAPIVTNVLFPGAGSAIGGALGLTGAAANVAGNAILGGGIGALTGGKRGALTGAGTGALMAGFNELGGFKGIGDRFGIGGGAAPGSTPGGGPEMPDARGLDILKTEVQPPGLEGVPVQPGEVPTPPPPSGIGAVAATAPSVRGAAGVPPGTTADKGGMSDLTKAGLIGGGLLLLGGMDAPQQQEDAQPTSIAAGFGGPLPKYELDRTYVAPEDVDLLQFGRGYKGRQTGTFFDAPGRYQQYKDGGGVDKPKAPAKPEKWNPFEKYDKYKEPGSWRGDEIVPNSRPSTRPAKAAERLEELGRGGDTILAHINPREAALLKAAGGSGTINPHTGLLEFSDAGVGESWSGGGTETSVGGFGNGVTADNIGGDAPIGQGGGQIADLSPEDQSLIDQGGLFSPSFSQDPMGYLGDKAKSWASDVRDNPVRSAIDLIASFTPIGTLNTLAGLLTGHTLGSVTTAAGRGIGDLAGVQNVGVSSPAQTPGGELAPSMAGADGIGNVPAPTGQLVTAPTAVEQMAAAAPTPAALASRRVRMPSNAELMQFGRSYGGIGTGSFYDAPNTVRAKDGGEISDGRSDDIPAVLSQDEYVLTAEDCALLGNGSASAGHKKLDRMRANLRKHKGGKLARGKISPDAKEPEQYIGIGRAA